MPSKLLPWLSMLGLLAALSLKLAAQPAAPAPAAAPAAQPPGRITVARVTGTVTLTDNATKANSPVANGRVFYQGSTISTANASSVILVFANGATINLGANSVLNVDTFTQDPFATEQKVSDMTTEPSHSTTEISLTRGELVGKVAHLKTDEGSSFTVSTPVGSAGIRGTTFRIVYTPTGNGQAFTFSLTTVEGNVAFRPNNGTRGNGGPRGNGGNGGNGGPGRNGGTTETGTVTSPVSVTTNQQISIVVNVDPVTGTVTIPPPPGAPAGTAPTIVVVPAAATAISQITNAAQQIAQAVANVVIPTTSSNSSSGSSGSGSSGSGSSGSGSSGSGSSGSTDSSSTTSPNPISTAVRITDPGDGT